VSDLALHSLVNNYRLTIPLLLYVLQLKLFAKYLLYVLLSFLAVKSKRGNRSLVLLHEFMMLNFHNYYFLTQNLH
jgi:hypothetical protein